MFKKYTFSRFKPYLKEINSPICSCGGHILSLVTGISLKHIHNIHPKNDDWRHEFMESFLKLSGYNLKLIPNDFYLRRRGFNHVFSPNHLLILVMAIDKKMSTWSCAYKGKVYHGGSPFEDMNPSEIFLNYPIELMWICYPDKSVRRGKR